jgi:hypothetical protein
VFVGISIDGKKYKGMKMENVVLGGLVQENLFSITVRTARAPDQTDKGKALWLKETLILLKVNLLDVLVLVADGTESGVVGFLAPHIFYVWCPPVKACLLVVAWRRRNVIMDLIYWLRKLQRPSTTLRITPLSLSITTQNDATKRC